MSAPESLHNAVRDMLFGHERGYYALPDTTFIDAVRAAYERESGGWTLARCRNCADAHDPSASCAAVAYARQRNDRRAHLETLSVFGAGPVQQREVAQ